MPAKNSTSSEKRYRIKKEKSLDPKTRNRTGRSSFNNVYNVIYISLRTNLTVIYF